MSGNDQQPHGQQQMAGNAEYDPFAEMAITEDSYARPRNISTLKRGINYRVIKFSQQVSKFQDSDKSYPLNLVAQYVEAGLKFQSIMPKKYNNKSGTWLDAMNKLIDNGVGPHIVYYGQINSSYEVDLLRHTEELNQEKLEMIKQINEESSASASPSPLKRIASDISEDSNGSPAKGGRMSF